MSSVSSTGGGRTALANALFRAAHQLLDGGDIFWDPLAVPILNLTPEEILHEIGQDPERSLMAIYVPMRSRFGEDAIAAAYALGVRQIVQLGAGLETFAYRNPYADTHVYELDQRVTIARKRTRLRAARIPVPANVTLVPIDFVDEAILGRLEAAGFDPSMPSIFVWLGVTIYLPERVVRATLRDLSALVGVSVVFDYMTPAGTIPADLLPPFEARAKAVAEEGEPWLSFFTPETMSLFLTEAGYTSVEDLSPEDASLRFLGATPEPPPFGIHMVVAST